MRESMNKRREYIKLHKDERIQKQDERIHKTPATWRDKGKTPAN
jgi:hypothetical protein